MARPQAVFCQHFDGINFRHPSAQHKVELNAMQKASTTACTHVFLIAHTVLSGRPKKRHRINKPIQIISIERHIHPIKRNHLMRAYSIEVIHRNIATSLKIHDAILADLAIALIGAIGAVVVEEAVVTGAVDENGVGVDDSQTPGIGVGDGDIAIDGGRGGELRVV